MTDATHPRAESLIAASGESLTGKVSAKRAGRPSASVLKRLGREGQLSPETWPDRNSECWDGPALISWQGKITRTPRACLNEMLQEPLHNTHRLQPVCKRDDCVNPHHFKIVMIRRQDGTPMEPLPMLAFGQTLLEDAEREVPLDEIAQDVRRALNDDPDLSDADLAVRFHHVYSEEAIRASRTVEL